jgi:hypothetical protein
MPRKDKQGRAVNTKCKVIFFDDTDDHWCTHHGKYILTCVWCDKDFHSARPHTQTCSNKCRMAMSRVNQLRLKGF